MFLHKTHAKLSKRRRARARPVLRTLDPIVLLQIGEHDDELDPLLVDHAPEVLKGGDQRSLGADPPFALLVAHHKVGVDVVAALHALHAGLEKTRFFFKPAQWVF